MDKALLFLSLSFYVFISSAQDFNVKNIKTNTTTSFRGLSVVDNKIAWASGSNGWIGHTTNGGKAWKFLQVKGFENSDFRSLYAFDEHKAIIANAGAPANILITTDKGVNWKIVYTNNDSAAFFDGIDFWNNNEGIIYGDAIDGRMLLLKTKDGGQNWVEIAKSPALEKGEASFAASGTGIRCTGEMKVVIATGGLVSRLWISEDKGDTWRIISPPIIQGENSTGIFSVAINDSIWNIVGGDYKNPPMNLNHNLYSIDNGRSWITPEVPTRGYRECVEFIADETWMASGPTGVDISYDGGKNWTPLSDAEEYHVLRKARNGERIIMAGGKGQISIVINEK